MSGLSQPNFKRRLTLKLNPDFSLMEFASACGEGLRCGAIVTAARARVNEASERVNAAA
jgi:hypothetical protein